MNTLHTDRLILRPLGPADAYAYATVRYHPAVARWLLPADDPLLSPSDPPEWRPAQETEER